MGRWEPARERYVAGFTEALDAARYCIEQARTDLVRAATSADEDMLEALVATLTWHAIYAHALCLMTQRTDKAARRVFQSPGIQDEIRQRAWSLATRALEHPYSLDNVPRATDFSRETKLNWEADPEASYRGSRAESVLTELVASYRARASSIAARA